MKDFSLILVNWQKKHGRHHLPWQAFSQPYERWLSEVMLQQTQVKTVIPYFNKFIKTFPKVEDLAQAPEDQVMALWAGLGYYSRARNLHSTAKKVVEEHSGIFPSTVSELVKLPGIGPSTAGAIAAFTSHERAVMVDGNVKRVLSRIFAIPGCLGEQAFEKKVWTTAESLLPESILMPTYTQALMDLGAHICKRTKPSCSQCPCEDFCQAYQQNKTEIFPGPKKKKDRPTKQAWLFLSLSSKGCFLNKKQQAGVWKSLWCPYIAEKQTEQVILTLVPSWFEEKVRYLHLEKIQHDFTHYRLVLDPIVIWSEKCFSDQEESYVCVPRDQIEHYGMPKPVERLLTSILKSEHEWKSLSRVFSEETLTSLILDDEQ